MQKAKEKKWLAQFGFNGKQGKFAEIDEYVSSVISCEVKNEPILS